MFELGPTDGRDSRGESAGLRAFFDAVAEGNVREVSRLFGGIPEDLAARLLEENSTFEDITRDRLCHPLCSCHECASVCS